MILTPPLAPAEETQSIRSIVSNKKLVSEVHTHVVDPEADQTVATEHPTMLDVFSKKGVTLAWASLLLFAVLNYLDGVALGTLQTYAVSEFQRLSIEGSLNTILGVVIVGMYA